MIYHYLLVSLYGSLYDIIWSLVTLLSSKFPITCPVEANRCPCLHGIGIVWRCLDHRIHRKKTEKSWKSNEPNSKVCAVNVKCINVGVDSWDVSSPNPLQPPVWLRVCIALTFWNWHVQQWGSKSDIIWFSGYDRFNTSRILSNNKNCDQQALGVKKDAAVSEAWLERCLGHFSLQCLKSLAQQGGPMNGSSPFWIQSDGPGVQEQQNWG